jgi:putative two-component system response regulator
VSLRTGSRDAATEVRGLESGAMDFLSKPANTEILRHRIELHLEFSAYQHQLEMIVNELEDNIGASFAELVECKDFNLGGHVLRTSALAALLTRQAAAERTFGDEIGEGDADLIKRAAPFHDIGKIGVSDLILLKRGPLSAAEYEEVKKHTIIGGKMMEAIYRRTPDQAYLKVAKVIAEGHHERYDGAGYPRGLGGDAIPVWCRIVAVANVYDACITDRIYRKGLSYEEAAQVIINGRGTEFDPRIVDVFERMKDKFALYAAQSQFQTKSMDWSIYHETNPGS